MNQAYVLKTLSIKWKLMLIMTVTSGITIILMTSFAVINQAFNNQRAIRQQLITLADILGARSTGALTFNDPATVTEILNGLALKSNVIYAVIERDNGESFATFGKSMLLNGLLEETQYSDSLWTNLVSNKMQVNRNIYLKGERIGKIRIISTMDELYDNLLSYMFLLAIISVICFVITLLICTRLQKLVSGPILSLQKTMMSISKDKDYSLRVDNYQENELGALVNGFNHMLEQIQSRDTKLGKYSTRLEKIITQRTIQLDTVNTQRVLWLETMASFLKHELKNSSVGIKTSLDLIERRSTEKKKVDVYLARARKSMATMNSLLQSAGDASNLEASLYKEKQKQLDLGAVMMSQIEMYPSIYPNILITENCQLGLIIQGNEVQLIQLLDKLISNAVEHCNDSVPIEISVKQHRKNALLTVINKGCALPKDKQAMFDLFASFRSLEQKTGDNFGLGLYIVKLIAESHGGHVTAKDLSMKSGAIFEVSFPLIEVVVNNGEGK